LVKASYFEILVRYFS